MLKFTRLVQNELIKTMAKIATIIILCLVVLLGVGWNILLASPVLRPHQWVDNTTYEDMRANAKREFKKRPNLLAVETARIDFLEAQKIPPTYSNDGREWRFFAANDVFSQKSAAFNSETDQEIEDVDLLSAARLKLFDRALDTIAKDDWKGYLNLWVLDASVRDFVGEDEIYAAEYRVKNDVPLQSAADDPNHWKDVLLEEQNVNFSMEPEGGEENKDTEILNRYQLEHNINTPLRSDKNLSLSAVVVSVMGSSGKPDFWAFLICSLGLMGNIGVLMMIIAGEMVSSEFSKGTVKFLLINPVKRWKILTSKYVALVVFTIAVAVGFFILNFLLAGIFGGFGNLGAPVLSVRDGTVVEHSGLLFVIGKAGVSLVLPLVLCTLGFALSSLFRNSAIAIAIALFLQMAGSGVTNLVGTVFHQDWARYSVFAATNRLEGWEMFPDMTVGFSLAVIAVYWVVFALTAWDGFVRRDVK